MESNRLKLNIMHGNAHHNTHIAFTDKKSYNLGQNKKEKLTPSPQGNNEAAKEHKRAIWALIIEMGEGGVVWMFHLFCPRL